MQENESPSLRERRRTRTWEAIHAAAAEQARAKGLKGTTAESIAEQAGVSTRTFFNYFPSKEDAVLGLREPQMSEQLLRTVPHPAKSSLPAYAAQIFLRVLRGSMSPEAAAASRETIRELPELRQRMKIHMLRCEQALQQFLLGMDWAAYAERRELVPRTEPDPEQVRRVRALVLLSAAILRHIDFGAGREIDEADAQISGSAALFSEILQEER
ncbi:TetR family transcriptional regulator [Rothia kristinae]|uniref:TetR family transcriptional regulator n=1 Tax=Rothia kristinae TaxID=37923 RepID=A0A7T4MSJ2_9MICC|nr:TetR family transcriptional regulator [Rothia kristinae]QQC58812.1 TetR family transcriptional regulator [Rothia kristinae]